MEKDKNVLQIWFTLAMIYWEVMDCVVKSKERARVKKDFFKVFQLCRGSLVRSSQNQLHVCACCNSLAGTAALPGTKGLLSWGCLVSGQGLPAHTSPLWLQPHQQSEQCQQTHMGTMPSHLCWFTAGVLHRSGNHVVNTVPSISILLGCPGLASIPGHCSRESIRQGMFPEVRIDESMMLRRGKESLAIWMEASPFALVLAASAMWWMFLLSMRKCHRYNTLDIVR